MSSTLSYITRSTLLFGFTLVVLSPLQAHLMVAQQGTLNFSGEDVYMVLSLPASAFSEADEDKDNKLSLTEFAQHRVALLDVVASNINLTDKDGPLPLYGVMISPVTPHNAPGEPASQLIVMGRFSLADSEESLSFYNGLYGNQAAEQSLKMTATRKSTRQKQVFALSPALSASRLFVMQE